jgi:hypothetical protein
VRGGVFGVAELLLCHAEGPYCSEEGTDMQDKESDRVTEGLASTNDSH